MEVFGVIFDLAYNTRSPHKIYGLCVTSFGSSHTKFVTRVTFSSSPRRIFPMHVQFSLCLYSSLHKIFFLRVRCFILRVTSLVMRNWIWMTLFLQRNILSSRCTWSSLHDLPLCPAPEILKLVKLFISRVISSWHVYYAICTLRSYASLLKLLAEFHAWVF